MLLDDEVIRLVGISDRALAILGETDRIIDTRLHAHLSGKGPVSVQAYVVYHNAVRGPPCKGGIRMSSDVTLQETIQLAEIMTYKTALMDLPFGGGKASIVAGSELPPQEKATLVREFAHKIRNELTSGAYVPAPDIGTSPREMAVIFGETHMRECVTGKPVGIGGLPGRREATGYGVAVVVEQAAKELLNSELSGLTVGVQGFGNVGSWACTFLSERGAKVVAVTDASGGAVSRDGIDIEELKKHVAKHGGVEGYGKHLSNEELFKLDVDILIPAAIGGVITRDNAGDIKARLIVEGANAPTAKEADEILSRRNIPLVPDILANAGGVVASYDEWMMAKSGSRTNKEETYSTVRKVLLEAFKETLDYSSAHEVSQRKSALALAAERLIGTMEDRGWV
jgi:glutamate dehydrogenase/leucine dehydrogenase